MYSVFHLEEGEMTFRAILLNNKKDIFAEKAIAAWGWNIADIKVHSYESDDILKYKQWMNDSDVRHTLTVDPVSFALQRVTRTPSYKTQTPIAFDADNALDYYSQSEIDNAIAIQAIIDQWRIDNPTPDVNTPDPDFGANIQPDLRFEAGVKEESFEVHESIAGTLVDIQDRIAQEAQAVLLGKTELIN